MSDFKCKECGLVHPWFKDNKAGDESKKEHQLAHERVNLWEFTDEMDKLRDIDFYAADKLDRIYAAYDKLKNYKFPGYERIK